MIALLIKLALIVIGIYVACCLLMGAFYIVVLILALPMLIAEWIDKEVVKPYGPAISKWFSKMFKPFKRLLPKKPKLQTTVPAPERPLDWKEIMEESKQDIN